MSKKFKEALLPRLLSYAAHVLNKPELAIEIDIDKAPQVKPPGGFRSSLSLRAAMRPRALASSSLQAACKQLDHLQNSGSECPAAFSLGFQGLFVTVKPQEESHT